MSDDFDSTVRLAKSELRGLNSDIDKLSTRSGRIAKNFFEKLVAEFERLRADLKAEKKLNEELTLENESLSYALRLAHSEGSHNRILDIIEEIRDGAKETQRWRKIAYSALRELMGKRDYHRAGPSDPWDAECKSFGLKKEDFADLEKERKDTPRPTIPNNSSYR